MARIDEDIVAKAAFYAGLSQTIDPMELPDDIRTNGNSLLKDAVESISSNKEVDRGIKKIDAHLVNGKIEFAKSSKLTPFNVLYKGKLLTLVGIEDFLTTYAGNTNVACIYHTTLSGYEEIVKSSLIVDSAGRYITDESGNIFTTNDGEDREILEDVICVETHLGDEDVTILCNRSIEVDNSKGFLRVDCRNEVRAYVIDYTAFLLASLYQMASKEDCANRMAVSLEHCKKVEVPHIMVADPYVGMANMQGQSPFRNGGSTSNPMRGY